MELKIKKLSEEAVMPKRAHEGDAGIDLTATRITQEINECGQLILVYHSDLAVEIPEGHVGLLFPRSSIYKKALTFCNAVGVIDSGYRGELTAKMRSTTDVVPAIYKPGERFAQLVIMPIANFTIIESTELTDTERGEDGYGSSDEVSAAEKLDSHEENTSTDQEVSEPAAVAEDATEKVA